MLYWVVMARFKATILHLIIVFDRKELLAKWKTRSLKKFGHLMILHFIVGSNIVWHYAWNSRSKFGAVLSLENMTVSEVSWCHGHTIVEWSIAGKVTTDRVMLIYRIVRSNHVSGIQDSFCHLSCRQQLNLSLTRLSRAIFKLD